MQAAVCASADAQRNAGRSTVAGDRIAGCFASGSDATDRREAKMRRAWQKENIRTFFALRAKTLSCGPRGLRS
ncbi:hypothetical protein [Lysobacter gummosus]|uniref:hypothetical protein n=1 Tax=Lysobacter gummosus TaxID=262324 RepID=UPI00363F37FE